MERTPRITHAEPHDDYTLTLTFTNGERRLFDAKPYLDVPVFRPLRDPSLFKQVSIDVIGSLEWPGGRDLGYDSVYAESRPLVAQEDAAAQH